MKDRPERGAGPGLLDGTASPPVGGAGDRVLLTRPPPLPPAPPPLLPAPFPRAVSGDSGLQQLEACAHLLPQACLAAGTAAPRRPLQGFLSREPASQGRLRCSWGPMWGLPAERQTRPCWTPRGLTVGQTQPQELAAPQPQDTTGAEPTRTPGLRRPWTELILEPGGLPLGRRAPGGPR